MKLQYLGTAAAEGWPATFCNCPYCQAARKLGGKNIRSRSQAILNDELLLDLPCDTYMHAINHHLDLSAVRWLVVTHSHTDHFYPAELNNRGGCYGLNMKSPELEIYCNKAVEDYFYRAAEHELNDDVRKRLHFHIVSPFTQFAAGAYTITPLPAKHMKTEQALFYLIEKDGHSLLYAHDTGRFYPEVYEFLENRGIPIDLISLDCTSGKIENGENNGHMGFPDALAVKNRLLSIGAADTHTQFVLNHFSHNGHMMYDELEERGKKAGMLPSYDGMTVEF